MYSVSFVNVAGRVNKLVIYYGFDLPVNSWL